MKERNWEAGFDQVSEMVGDLKHCKKYFRLTLIRKEEGEREKRINSDSKGMKKLLKKLTERWNLLMKAALSRIKRR